MPTYTKTELQFKELHKELLELKLYTLADSFASVFYKNSHENYIAGAAMVNEIFTNSERN